MKRRPNETQMNWSRNDYLLCTVDHTSMQGLPDVIVTN